MAESMLSNHNRKWPVSYPEPKPVLVPLLPSQLPDELRGLNKYYQQRMKPYIEQNLPYWTEKLGLSSGTFNDLECGFTAIWGLIVDGYAGAGRAVLTGCIEIQSETLRIIKQYEHQDEISGWVFEKYQIGNVLEHHAVCARRKGESHESGMIFDAWAHLHPDIFNYKDWTTGFLVHGVLGKPRPEGKRASSG